MKLTKAFFYLVMPLISVLLIAASLFVELYYDKLFSLPVWGQKLLLSILQVEANLGDGYAQVDLSAYEFKKHNTKEGINWLTKAADGGYEEAAYRLGQIYYFGKYVTADKKKAAEWFQKAKDLGSIDAITDLGTLYSKGEGVEKNLQKAFDLDKLGAEKGDYVAMYNLGLTYSQLDKEERAVPVNYEAAAQWYEKSLEKNPRYCAANDLGILYALGKGVEQDQEEAKKLFTQAFKSMTSSSDFPAFNEKGKSANFLNAFVEYQYSSTLSEDIESSMQSYTADEVDFAKVVSEKLIKECWK